MNHHMLSVRGKYVFSILQNYVLIEGMINFLHDFVQMEYNLSE